MRSPRVWGATHAEVGARYPCDPFFPDARDAWFRAVTIAARREVVFRWLCQLKVAPYSYDLLDNRGRHSPRVLTPGTERLAVGQRVMTIFELADFEIDHHLTLVLSHRGAERLFGDFALSYVVSDVGREMTTRLVVKLVLGRRNGVLGGARRYVLAWGDLFMMRKQLATLRALAEGC